MQSVTTAPLKVDQQKGARAMVVAYTNHQAIGSHREVVEAPIRGPVGIRLTESHPATLQSSNHRQILCPLCHHCSIVQDGKVKNGSVKYMQMYGMNLRSRLDRTSLLLGLREQAQRCGNDTVLKYIPKGTSYET